MAVVTAEVEHAVEVLRLGGVVAFPTETVYGLGADADNLDAVHRVFAIKGRPADHPLIVHLADPVDIDDWAAAPVDPAARALAAAFWPGPLTLVLPRAPRVRDAVTGGRETVGLRVPDAPIASALLRAFGGGVAAPSANRFGHVSPTTAGDVRADLGDLIDVVLDGGPCAVGVESTIVEVLGDALEILRPGAVTADDIEMVTGRSVRRESTGRARAPGMLAAHYAPHVRVMLTTTAALAADVRTAVAAGRRAAVLAPEPVRGLGDDAILLDPAGPPEAYARVLYQRLRAADRAGVDVLFVVPPPATGVGVAVRDRLRRAAHAPGGG